MNEELKTVIKNRVISQLDFSLELKDEEIKKIIDKVMLQEINEEYIPLKEKSQFRKELFNSLRGLDVLTELLGDEEISEIMVLGNRYIFVEKQGRIIKTNKVIEDEDKLNTIIQQIVADCNRRINEANPIVDARLRDGSRVNIVIGPVALDGPVITIRKFPDIDMDILKLVEMNTFPQGLSKILEAFVKAKYNIFISGGTGSGKTTLLNAISNFIPKDERVITIEDSAELKIQGIENLVRLETRNANTEGANSISIRDLIKTSLRMRPDRIIVGEVRDGAAIDMLQAMNTGHEGSLSTGHANSPEDMLNRLETMVLMGMDIPLVAVRKQISQAVDIVIHLGRLRDKTRKILNISEVTGMKNGEIQLKTLYEFVETGEQAGRIVGSLKKVNQLLNMNKLISSNMKLLYEEGERELQCI